MEYNSIDTLSGKKLWLLNRGSHYDLTNNIILYGRMYNDSSFVSKTFFETKDETIFLLNSAIGDLSIKTPEDKMIGYYETSGKLNLKLNNGFRANWGTTSFFSSEYCWIDENGNELIRIFGNDSSQIAITSIKSFLEVPNLNVLILAGVKTIFNRNEVVND